jgi:hypothetical protein
MPGKVSNMPPNISGIFSDNWQCKRNQLCFLSHRSCSSGYEKHWSIAEGLALSFLAKRELAKEKHPVWPLIVRSDSLRCEEKHERQNNRVVVQKA